MTSGYEPVLHALAVEPPVARPGDVVRVRFRTRNVGTLPSPAAAVAFELPDGLEAIEETEATLLPAAPGEPAVATIRARVMAPCDDRTELSLQAFLVLPERRLATNVCVLRVRSRPVLDGESSGTFVERVDADTVRVHAVITNEGDGPALGVRVRLPPPPGCRRLDGDDVAALDVERLEPGASLTLGFVARIEHAMPVVRADGGEVRFGAGSRRPLPVRSAVTLQPVLAPPALLARPQRRSVEVAVDLRNDGWAPAHDACLRVALPAGLQLVGESVTIDGAPLLAGRSRRGAPPAVARLQRQEGAHAIVISLLPARSTTQLRFTANHAGEYEGGTLVIHLDEHRIDLDYRAEPRRDLRIAPIDVPPAVVPGETVTIRVRVVNAGDRLERVGVALLRAGLPETLPARRTLDPGTCAVVDLPLSIAAAAIDAHRLPFAVIATDADGERVRADLFVTVRHPVVAETNAERDDDGWAERITPAVHAALHAPDEVVAGAPLAVRLDVDVEDALERCTIRVAELEAARYIPGSTSVGGCAILDAAGSSPLHGAGLVLRGVPPATRVTIGWSLLVGSESADLLAIGVELDADGHRSAIAPLSVRVRSADAFATRPAQLTYHVDACTLATCVEAGAPLTGIDPIEHRTEIAEPATRDDDDRAVAPAQPVRIRALRWDDIARLLHGVRCGGLVLHVLVLRAFFPEPGDSEGGVTTAARDAVGHALRDVFDRLFVKLRIPGFVVGADDLEDARLRQALIDLVDPDGSNLRYAALADAPFGAPAALRTLLAAIPPPECDAPLDAATAEYLHLLDVALASYEGLPVELFDEALARNRDVGLDDARAALLALVDERVTRRPIAC